MVTRSSMERQQRDTSSQGASYLRGTVGQQKMVNLLSLRVETGPPFLYCAVDYSVSGMLRRAGNNLKGTEPYLLAWPAVQLILKWHTPWKQIYSNRPLRHFIRRKGPIRGLCSNKGTNFTVAENELKAAPQEMDDEKPKAELLKGNIKWIRTPATASNFRGVLERQMRSVRNVMATLLKRRGHSLDNESLQTLLG